MKASHYRIIKYNCNRDLSERSLSQY